MEKLLTIIKNQEEIITALRAENSLLKARVARLEAEIDF